jgi:hypothetical protein
MGPISIAVRLMPWSKTYLILAQLEYLKINEMCLENTGLRKTVFDPGSDLCSLALLTSPDCVYKLRRRGFAVQKVVP